MLGAGMTDLEQRIEALEAQLRGEPESVELREELLGLYSDPAFQEDPRKVALVLWIVQRHPRTSFARCPLAHLYGEALEDGRRQVEHAWQRHVDEHPRDSLLIRGLANFVASFDRARACTLLEDFVAADPTDAEVWMELGRIDPTPARSLACLQQARKLGSSQPNLLAWIARAAMRADDRAAASQVGQELLARADEARRAHGERVDWTRVGSDLFRRAVDDGVSRADARKLVHAVAQHANDKHWGHTVLGVVALRGGDATQALEHLRCSAEVGRDYRLSSYGPSFALAQALCEQGYWSTVADYLTACESFWDVDRLRELRSDVEQQQVPDF